MTGAVKPLSLHATIVAIGEAGVLVRGGSGAGKSRLARDVGPMEGALRVLNRLSRV